MQRITGSLLGNNFRMFGQSVSGGVDIDSNNYPGNAFNTNTWIAYVSSVSIEFNLHYYVQKFGEVVFLKK